jgi:hypothetical protein
MSPLLSASPIPMDLLTLKLLVMARAIPLNLTASVSGAYGSHHPIFRFHFSCISLLTVHRSISVPTLLISPWVGKGVIEHNGINNGLTYTHSSLAAFISTVCLAPPAQSVTDQVLTVQLITLSAVEPRRRHAFDHPYGVCVVFRAPYHQPVPFGPPTHTPQPRPILTNYL